MIGLLWTGNRVDTGDLSDKLMECVRKNQLDEATQLTRSLSLEERTVIVGRPDKDGRTALCIAVKVVGNVEFVKFLLDECGANVEQCGFIEALERHDYDDVVKCQVVWTVCCSYMFEAQFTFEENTRIVRLCGQN